MKKIVFILLASFVITACIPTGGAGVTIKPIDTSINLTKIAIGSCNRQDLNMSIFTNIKNQNPDLYIAMGDNMYADNLLSNPNYAGWIQAQYDILNNNYDFKTMRATIQTIATWDDHDYGINNAGKEFIYKTQSKDLFLNFWNEPSTSPRRTRDGIYTSYMYGDDAHKVQIIVLDCRYNLDVISNEPISPTTDTTKSILGATQWAWLASELTKPAKVRIVVSSSQMCIQNNGWEGWPNYPHELNKFFKTVKDANAEGVFVVSGDVHYSEFSKRTPAGQYPIYDFTSSGLTHTESRAAANSFRIGTAYTNLSFGIIDINWAASPVQLSLNICDFNGNVAKQQVISLDELKF
jgi:alkaline phosphatase D